MAKTGTPALTPDQHERLHDLKAAGFTILDLMIEFRCSEPTVRKYLSIPKGDLHLHFKTIEGPDADTSAPVCSETS